jgi:hypothetical protein
MANIVSNIDKDFLGSYKQKEVGEAKTFIGSVSTCMAKNCSGRYVDFSDHYYILCNDPKHSRDIVVIKSESEEKGEANPSSLQPTGATTASREIVYYECKE